MHNELIERLSRAIASAEVSVSGAYASRGRAALDALESFMREHDPPLKVMARQTYGGLSRWAVPHVSAIQEARDGEDLYDALAGVVASNWDAAPLTPWSAK